MQYIVSNSWRRNWAESTSLLLCNSHDDEQKNRNYYCCHGFRYDFNLFPGFYSGAIILRYHTCLNPFFPIECF